MLSLILFISVNCRINYVDLIELNEFKTGSIYREQIILWDWSHEFRRYDVVDWYFVDDQEEKLPIKVGNFWQIRFIKERSLLHVRARCFRRTKTEYDPERKNLVLVPDRRKLCGY